MRETEETQWLDGEWNRAKLIDEEHTRHDLPSHEEIEALAEGRVMAVPLRDDFVHEIADAWREQLITNGSPICDADKKYRELLTTASLGNLRNVTIFHRLRASEALREPLIQVVNSSLNRQS
jgi:hypothetical protein